MKTHDIKEACRLAAKFTTQATELLQARENDGTHPKESGACRRASMDLTRSLAQMRRRG